MKIASKFFVIIGVTMSFSYVSLAQSTIDMQQLDKQGHRGCRGLLPENTTSAFLKAIDLGVNTLEMDVVITKDNQVILSHEPFFNHEITTLPNGGYVSESDEKALNIYKMPYSEVIKYDVGLKVHSRFPQQQKMKVFKPLLSAVIDSVETYAKINHKQPLFYNIETKMRPQADNLFHPEPKEFVDLMMGVILQKKIEDRVIIQSFDIRSLQYLHQKYPNIKTALLVEAFDKKELLKQIEDLGFTPTIYSPAQELVNLKLVQECRVKKIKLIPWTVNDLETIHKFTAMGVDGIISDYPNLFFEEQK
nr:glycerophosphodiester phosphodiesterase family protein [uncultured Flavobacterium sp.]